MRRIGVLLAVVAMCVSLAVFTGGEAYASYANAYSYLDWSSFGTTGTATVTFRQNTLTAYVDINEALADGSHTPSTLNNWTSRYLLRNTSTTGYAWAELYYESSKYNFAQSSAYNDLAFPLTPDVPYTTYSYSYSKALGSLSGGTSGGDFSVSLPVNMWITLDTTNMAYPGYVGSAYAKVHSSFGIGETGNFTISQRENEISAGPGEYITWANAAETINLNFHINPGETKDFYFTTEAIATATDLTSSVPVPGAVLLLGSGLLGLVGLRRKRSK